MGIVGLQDENEGAGGKLEITDLKQGVKNPNRVNVFIDEEFALSLDVAQVVDFHLKIGLVLTPERLTELKKASEFGKLYQRALEWVLARPRSEKETRDYLRRKLQTSSSGTLPRARRCGAQSLDLLPVGRRGPSEDVSELSHEILARLKSKGYVDDEKFARYFVENRFVKKGVSSKRLRLELAQKGVAKEIIEEVMAGSERNDADELQKMYAKKRLHYDDEKLMAYLCRQGFSYDDVKKIVLGDE